MNRIEKFRFWCHKVLPLVYDDSLSYYEFLCKVLKKLNEMIDNQNEIQEAYEEIIEELPTFAKKADITEAITALEEEVVGAVETANTANQKAEQAISLTQETMEMLGAKASLDYVDELVQMTSDYLSESINAVAADVNGKVDKRVGGGTEAIMYGQAKDGTERKYTIGVSVTTGNTVPMRDPSGNIYAADPTANQQVATKGYVDNAISGTGNVPTPTSTDKDKVLTAGDNGTFSWNIKPVKQVSTDNIVYGRIEGAEAALPLATGSPTANTIARRGNNGTLTVGTPTNNNHAATKGYVDSAISTVTKIGIITLSTNITWTSVTDWETLINYVENGIIKIHPAGGVYMIPVAIIHYTEYIHAVCHNGTSIVTYDIYADGNYVQV